MLSNLSHLEECSACHQTVTASLMLGPNPRYLQTQHNHIKTAIIHSLMRRRRKEKITCKYRSIETCNTSVHYSQLCLPPTVRTPPAGHPWGFCSFSSGTWRRKCWGKRFWAAQRTPALPWAAWPVWASSVSNQSHSHCTPHVTFYNTRHVHRGLSASFQIRKPVINATWINIHKLN